MDHNFPPLSDLAKFDESDDGPSFDLARAMEAIAHDLPVDLSKVRPGAYPAKPGRADAAELLKYRPGVVPTSSTTPKPAAPHADIEEKIKTIVAAKVADKATSPSTMSRPETVAAPAQPTSPAPGAWDWSTPMETIGVTPRANPEHVEPKEGDHRFRNAEIGDLEKRAASSTRENAVIEWMRREVAKGETVEGLAQFAEANGHVATANQIRELGKLL